MTLPSLLNMLTSSICVMGWTFIFLRTVWSFLSSVPDDLWTFLIFRRGVPLPLYSCQSRSLLSSLCREASAAGGARLWSLCFDANGSCRQAEFEEDGAEREVVLPYTLVSSTKPLVYRLGEILRDIPMRTAFCMRASFS